MAIAALLTAGFLGWQLRRPPRFPVHAELLIRENALSSDRQSLSRADMRSFVENVAFTSAHLEQIIDRHHLYRQAVARSSVLALLEMRKDIEVEILQDYFAEYRLDNSAQRSVRIVITFTGDDPLEASAVTQDLGELVAQAELGRHADRARRNARLARMAAERIREDVKETAESLAILHLALGTDPELPLASDQLKRSLLQARMDRLEARRSEAEQQETLFDLTAESEAKQAGTRVHVAPLQTDIGIEQDASRWLKSRAAYSGLLGMGLALVLVGAFNPRLYDADDVRRAGGSSLGALPNESRRGNG
jgi:hypothetical protein